MTYRAFLLIDSYLYGFVMQEVHWPFEEADIPQVAEAMTTQLSPEDYPHLLEVNRHVMTASAEGNFGGVFDAEFRAGLELKKHRALPHSKKTSAASSSTSSPRLAPRSNTTASDPSSSRCPAIPPDHAGRSPPRWMKSA